MNRKEKHRCFQGWRFYKQSSIQIKNAHAQQDRPRWFSCFSPGLLDLYMWMKFLCMYKFPYPIQLLFALPINSCLGYIKSTIKKSANKNIKFPLCSAIVCSWLNIVLVWLIWQIFHSRMQAFARSSRSLGKTSIQTVMKTGKIFVKRKCFLGFW